MKTNHKPDPADILARYGRHDASCPLVAGPILPGDTRCTCGLSASYHRYCSDYADLRGVRYELANALKALSNDISESGHAPSVAPAMAIACLAISHSNDLP